VRSQRYFKCISVSIKYVVNGKRKLLDRRLKVDAFKDNKFKDRFAHLILSAIYPTVEDCILRYHISRFTCL